MSYAGSRPARLRQLSKPRLEGISVRPSQLPLGLQLRVQPDLLNQRICCLIALFHHRIEHRFGAPIAYATVVSAVHVLPPLVLI